MATGKWIAIGIFLASVSFASATQYFVDENTEAPPNPSGLNWGQAFPTLQDALAIATSDGDIIWCAAGTYYPDEGGGASNGDRTESFVLPDVPNLKIYGGFDGTEANLEDRDIEANVTILSGDIDEDAVLDSDNSYHVITATDTPSTLRLDGFTITGGYADTSGSNRDVGGAILIAGTGDDSELRVFNCTFTGNFASTSGGAIYNFQGSPVFVNCQFTGNGVASGPIYTDNGGAFYTDGGSTPAFGDAVLVNCRFDNNDAAMHGGGMYINHCSPTLTNCVFWRNDVTSTDCDAADECGGGAIFLTCDSQTNCNATTPTITNCTFSLNTVVEDADTDCGGLYSYRTHTPNNGSKPTVTNSIFWDNKDDAVGTNSEEANILEGGGANAPLVTYTSIHEFDPMGDYGSGTGNIGDWPKFINQSVGDLHLEIRDQNV